MNHHCQFSNSSWYVVGWMVKVKAIINFKCRDMAKNRILKKKKKFFQLSLFCHIIFIYYDFKGWAFVYKYIS